MTKSTSSINWLAVLLCMSLMCGLTQAETNVLDQVISPSNPPEKTQENQADINAAQTPVYIEAHDSPSEVSPENTSDELIFPEDADLTVNTETTAEDADPYSNIITIESDDLWERIKAGYGMQDLSSSLVVQHEKQYSANPEYMKNSTAQIQST